MSEQSPDPVVAAVLTPRSSASMHSTRPTALHVLCGRPLVLYAIDALAGIDPDRIVVVVGDDGEPVSKKITERAADARVGFVELSRGGTGDAVAAVVAGLDEEYLDEADLVVLPGDAPLLPPATVSALLAAHRAGQAAATVLTLITPAPADATPIRNLVTAPELDRIVRRADGRIVGVASLPVSEAGQGQPVEWVTGVWAFRLALVAPALRRIPPDGSGETALGRIVDVLAGTGHRVEAVATTAMMDILTVGDRQHLADAERELRARTNRHWMANGVTMVDPERTYIDTTVLLGADVTLFPGVMLQGETRVGPGVEIGPDTRLADCVVGAGAVVDKSTGREAEIGPGAVVGPFAVLEPGAQIPPATVTGPFYHALPSEPAEPRQASPEPPTT